MRYRQDKATRKGCLNSPNAQRIDKDNQASILYSHKISQGPLPHHADPNYPPSPSTNPDADSDHDSDSDSASDSTPPYTPSELAAIILDFYTFLTTLHFPASGLKRPPPGGWPSLTEDSCAAFKSPLAIEVLRQLPYFDKSTEAYVHYKSRFVDYLSLAPSYFAGDEDNFIYADEPFESAEGDPVDMRDVICLACGRESGGRGYFLDVLRGEVTDDIVRVATLGAMDVVEFFDKLKGEYKSLKLIPYTGHLVIEAEEVEDLEGEDVDVGAEVMKRQSEEWWTETDVRWVRGVYRRWGWPDRFQRAEAEREVHEVMCEMEEAGREGWEMANVDAPEWCAYVDNV
ncbi:hypothetical protein ACJ72_01678 [Emergomyces africanus]|uniref:Uncharacterized protein n=1 Tax=Emergomyces africanus TaxID=1955775 RepID=A0A1B7P505_9EURO|nr:hypothetical protein ACJ72_01678 [Emergomyces africanus]